MYNSLTIWRYALTFFVAVLSLQGLAQHRPGEVSEKHSDWSSSVSRTDGLKVGDVVTLRFDGTIYPGWHAYSVIPPEKVANQPTRVELDPETRDVVAVGKLTESGKLEEAYDDIFLTKVRFFHDKVTFSQQFRITGPNPRITGVMKVQVCTEAGKCVYPDQNFDFKLKTVAEAAPVAVNETTPPDDTTKQDTIAAANPTSEPAALSTPETATTTPAEAEAPSEVGLLGKFFLAFLAGIAALITPCVFPMVPMTVSYFTKRAANRARGLRDALFYAGSIIFTFTVLGLLITIIFGAGALHELSTNTWLNVAFFAILVIFGLSFLGMFDLTLPSSWTTKMDKMSDQGGLAGIYFMALTLSLASFSCTGPIAGLILVDAASGSLFAPAIGMLGFSSGFALPFFLFALFPGMMQSLPKSGGWLNAVKVTLGFLELALSLKFLSMADLKEHWGLLDREIFIGVWVVLFALLGLYLLGKIRLPHDTPVDKVSVPRLMLAVASFSFVLYLAPGLWGAPLEKMAGILPPLNRELGVRPSPFYAGEWGGGAAESKGEVCSRPRKYADLLADHAPPGFCMFYDLDEGLAYAKEKNMPVFIDFTGHTCANCRLMENNVWVKPEIREILTKEYVMISLYVDESARLPEPVVLEDGRKLRTVGDQYKHLQETRYKQSAQPYYVLADAQLNDLSQGVGYTPDVAEYAAFLRKGVDAFKSRPSAAR